LQKLARFGEGSIYHAKEWVHRDKVFERPERWDALQGRVDLSWEDDRGSGGGGSGG
jgi:hypothetical protein